jgi:UDP-N-acetylglucosamine 2-epimerase (non-hydrolysing)
MNRSNKKIYLDIIAGARPNFMKIAPIIHAIHKYNETGENLLNYRLIHTGQHYDKLMSESFFEQLEIPKPEINLGAGGGSQAEQTAAIMIGYEKVLQSEKPDLCIVVGDVTSTMACTIVAKKAGVKVAHVEGGIRSGDMDMPEEVNRIVTDSITDFFFTTTKSAGDNLIKQGIKEDCIYFVGNTMIDSLLRNLSKLIQPEIYVKYNLEINSYLVLTLHRPSNVDNLEKLIHLLQIIDSHCENKKVIFPIHPRTKKIFESVSHNLKNIFLSDPLPYLEFIYLIKNSAGIITDSGGITEEATVLKVPCITLRNTTERPETVTIGSNILAGTKPENIIEYIRDMVNGKWKKGAIPELWDGKTAERIIERISNDIKYN